MNDLRRLNTSARDQVIIRRGANMFFCAPSGHHSYPTFSPLASDMGWTALGRLATLERLVDQSSDPCYWLPRSLGNWARPYPTHRLIPALFSFFGESV